MKQFLCACYMEKKTVSNDAMKPSEIKDHLERVYTGIKKNSSDLDYVKVLKEKNEKSVRAICLLKKANALGSILQQGSMKGSTNLKVWGPLLYANMIKEGWRHQCVRTLLTLRLTSQNRELANWSFQSSDLFSIWNQI